MPVLTEAPHPPAKVQTTPIAGDLRSLRKLRERLVREGNFREALRVARVVADRAPSRESIFWVGVLCREVGNYSEALRKLHRARKFRSGPAHLIADIHLHKAFTWFLLGKRKRMLAALRRAYRGPVKPRTGFNFHMSLGSHYLDRFEYRKAWQEFVRAEEAARVPICRGRAARNRGWALLRLGDLSASRKDLDRARRIHKRHGQEGELAETRLMRAAWYFDAGKPGRALLLLKQARAVFHAAGRAVSEASALQNIGYAAGELGRWEESRTALDEAIRLAQEKKRWQIEVRARTSRALARAQLDLFRESEEDLADAKRILVGRRASWSKVFVARAEARLAGLYAQWAEMRRAARRGERVAGKIRDWVRVIEFRKLRALAEERLGRAQAARFAHRTASKLARLLGGSSPAMRRLADVVKRLAPSDLSLVIVGETGTGKTNLARHIHAASRRARRRCALVACEQLVFPASELYGHVKGAWTNARADSPGAVRRALGGTVVLDRVDELPRDEQRVLIPLLEKRVRPEGSAVENKIDVRLIGTCQRPERLIPAVRERLAGAELRMPPLRERREEIPFLVEEILRDRRKITVDALTALALYRWEGNLAELRAVVDRLVVLSDHVIGRTLVRRVIGTREYVPESDRPARLVYRKRRTKPRAPATRSTATHLVSVPR